MARIGIGIGTSRRRRGAGGPAVARIRQVGTSIAEDAAIGALVGTASVRNAPEGVSYVFSLSVNPGGKLAFDGAALEVAGELDHDTAPTIDIEITATPDDESAVLTRAQRISVTNVLEETLGDVTLSSTTFIIGTPSSGTINGETAGGEMEAASLPSGLTIDEVAGAWEWDGTGTEATGDLTITETHPDGSNSPKVNVIGWEITDVPPIPDGALTDDNGDYLLADNGDYLIMEAA